MLLEAPQISVKSSTTTQWLNILYFGVSLNKSKKAQVKWLDIIQATEDAAEATTGMVARAGRASYVHPSNLCQADPGAKAVAVWMRAIYTALSTGTVNMLTIE